MLTKGDNNRVDDRGLYAPGQLWLKREDILGRAQGTLRYLGMVTIILNDYPILKYVLIGERMPSELFVFLLFIVVLCRSNGSICTDEQRILVSNRPVKLNDERVQLIFH